MIAYHGTNEVAARSILADGFREGTYFAFHLEDALTFGGPVVFAAKFDPSGFAGIEDGWQFHLREAFALGALPLLWCRKYEAVEWLSPHSTASLFSEEMTGRCGFIIPR